MKLVPEKLFVSAQDLEHSFDPFQHQPSVAAEEAVDAGIAAAAAACEKAAAAVEIASAGAVVAVAAAADWTMVA